MREMRPSRNPEKVHWAGASHIDEVEVHIYMEAILVFMTDQKGQRMRKMARR